MDLLSENAGLRSPRARAREALRNSWGTWKASEPVKGSDVVPWVFVTITWWIFSIKKTCGFKEFKWIYNVINI